MENSNSINVQGNDNQIYTDLKAGRDIVFNIADNLPSEVKEKKQTLKLKLQELRSNLTKLKEQTESETLSELENKETDKTEDPAVDWKSIMLALKYRTCILFIGPDISLDDGGNSIHENFFKELSQLGKTEYFEDEGLLTYISKSQILQYISEFYHEEFQNQNKKGRMLQEKLAQIPFSLVVSMCPDDTFHQIYNDYNLKHLYIYFNGILPACFKII